MVKSPAERVREFRQRQKDAARSALLSPAPSSAYLKTPFSEFVGGRHFEFDENLDAYGVRLMGTSLDEEVQDFPSEFEREGKITALERARGLMGVFLDAAKELAETINAYKLAEIERAIDAAIEASANLPRGDVERLKESFDEIERLKAIRSELRRPTRHTLLGVDAKGE